MTRVKSRVDQPLLVIGWSLPRAYDKRGNLQALIRDALGTTLGPAFIRDDDLVAMGAVLQRGKYGSTLMIGALLSEASDPEGTMDRILDQLVKLWIPGGGANARQLRAIAAEQWRMTRWRTGAIVGMAAAFESLVGRNLQRAETAHLLGDFDVFGRDMDAILTLPGSDVSQFGNEWLSRARARGVIVEPEGGATTTGQSNSAVFASVSPLRVSISPEVLLRRVAPVGATVKTVKLDSGLEVVLAKRSSAPLVALTLAARGGEADSDPAGAASMAEYAEILETKNGKPEDFGVTRRRWSDRASSYIQLRAASGNLENALGMLLDAVGSQHVDAATDVALDFYFKRRAQKEFALPSSRAERALLGSVYARSALEQIPSPEQYMKVSPSSANGWMARTWIPGNTVLTIAGDIDLAEAEAAVRRWFAGWRPGGTAKPATVNLPGRPPEAPVPIISTARPGARQTTLEVACAVPLAGPTDLVATQVLANRMATRLNQTSRLVLGATYGFQEEVRVVGGHGEIRVRGALEERVLARVLAIVRSQAGALGQPPPPEELARFVWREGIQSSARLERATSLGRAIADLRLASLPADTYERYPELLKQLRAEDVARVGEGCRRTATIGLLGDPPSLERAVRSTGG